MLVVEEAFAAEVEPELFGDVLEAVARLPEDDRGFEATSITIVKLWAEQDRPFGERAILATAISFRLQALAQLTNDGGGRGWTIRGKSGCDYVHSELVRCAAEEQLIQIDGQPAFDPGSFHARLLALAEMRGEA